MEEDIAMPSNLDEMVEFAYGELSEEDKQFIVGTTTTDGMHHGYGRFLRNKWSLWDTSTKLSKWFQKEYNLAHGDDLSSIIIDALFAKVKGIEPNTLNIVNDCLQHWKEYGVEPITGENLNK